MTTSLLTCKRCQTSYGGTVVPNGRVRCPTCRKKIRVPTESVLAERCFIIRLETEETSISDVPAVAKAFATARLAGVSNRKLRQALYDHGVVTMDHEQEILRQAMVLIRSGARAEGSQMMLFSVIAFACCGVITLVSYSFKAQTGVILIEVGGLAVGAIYGLFGLFKWITGSTLR